MYQSFRFVDKIFLAYYSLECRFDQIFSQIVFNHVRIYKK